MTFRTDLFPRITGEHLSLYNYFQCADDVLSGLVNQSVIALGITIICITSQELMKRKRRYKYHGETEGFGSRESWEFG